MKIPAIVGGIGPESTIEYYRLLITEYRSRVHDGSYPSILVNSIDLAKMLRLIEAGELGATADYLAGEVLRVAKAGATFAALASNTPHIVFDELRHRSPIPLLSIVEAARDATVALGLKRVGLLGTRFTMQGTFYPTVFSGSGIAVVMPESGDQAFVHEAYLGELVKGSIRPQTRERLLAIVDRMRARQQVDGIVLGGTEWPLILRHAPHSAVPLLDTTTIHVRRIVDEMLS